MPAPPDPDLRGVTAAFVGASAPFVVIGGFAVVANDYVRATEDVDLLIGEDDDAAVDRALIELDAHWQDGRPYEPGGIAGREHTRLVTSAGLVDLLREGEPPLDLASVSRDALRADLGDGEFLVAGLASIVAFKRLAGRPRDRGDLEELARLHGELPLLPLPGVDEDAR